MLTCSSVTPGASSTSEPLWPKDQQPFTPEELADLYRKCREAFVETAKELEIEEDLTLLLGALYLPLAGWLERRRAKHDGALVVGLCGPQGSGKSTLSALLKSVLGAGWGRKVAVLPIDGLYKTKSDREIMAKTIHPMFATRGVPGTHDIQLGIDTIESLKASGPGESTAIPAFDKARDDRQPRETWATESGPVDLIIFEGWCVGALPEPPKALTAPINDLEREEDPDGTWRRTANSALAGEYQKLFGLIDILFLLKVDGMERVFEWRGLQERKLARKIKDSELPSRSLTVMSEAELHRFIFHYERLTRHILAEMPRRADVVFFLDETHNAAKVRVGGVGS